VTRTGGVLIFGAVLAATAVAIFLAVALSVGSADHRPTGPREGFADCPVASPGMCVGQPAPGKEK
jgi:hypothetical protein